MTHPNANNPGNVKLWRCHMAGMNDCQDCYHRHAHVAEFQCEDQVCERNRPYRITAKCVIVGFRTPPRCEDCEHKDDPTFPCPACRYNGRRNFTPRQQNQNTSICHRCSKLGKCSDDQGGIVTLCANLVPWQQKGDRE